MGNPAAAGAGPSLAHASYVNRFIPLGISLGWLWLELDSARGNRGLISRPGVTLSQNWSSGKEIKQPSSHYNSLTNEAVLDVLPYCSRGKKMTLKVFLLPLGEAFNTLDKTSHFLLMATDLKWEN